MKDSDVLKLDRPKKNQPLDYYASFLQKLNPLVNLFEIRLGFLRWLQGTALEEAITSSPACVGPRSTPPRRTSTRFR